MHEHTFIQSIIKQVPESEKVKKIEIELGDLVGIEANHLKEHLVEQTDWIVEVKVRKSKVKCSCGYIGEARILQRLHDLVIYNCPNCSKNPEVLEGQDLKIVKVVYM